MSSLLATLYFGEIQSVTIVLMEEQQTEWSYSQESEVGQAPVAPHQSISWTGSEFIAQQKSSNWYLGLIAALTLACGVIYLISRDLISIVFVAIMGVLFAVIASKQPRQLQYIIDDQGITVGKHHYTFDEFKTFSIMRDGGIGYISLLPLQRIRPELTIYYAPDDEQKIFDVLASYLPHEDRHERMVDKFARTIRF